MVAPLVRPPPRPRPAEYGEAPPGGPARTSGLTAEQPIYLGRAEGRLIVPNLEGAQLPDAVTAEVCPLPLGPQLHDQWTWDISCRHDTFGAEMLVVLTALLFGPFGLDLINALAAQRAWILLS
jgi:hypothetical protein